jgi:sugar phosphate isomerase/epimerase
VSPTLAAAARGELTGIAVSHCAIGDGANAENIRRCIELLAEDGYDGVLSMECEGAGGPMIEKSLDWLRGVMERMESRARPSKTDVVPA